jgi:hypothetical protein
MVYGYCRLISDRMKQILIVSVLLAVTTVDQAQTGLAITDRSSGLSVLVVNKDLPLLKILLPNQPLSDRGIEVEFPEHVTGVNKSNGKVEQLYFVSLGNRNKRTAPVWKLEKNTIIYDTDLQDGVHLTAKATLEPDGLSYSYIFTNRSGNGYQNLGAITCVKLYSVFSDTLLKRTYVHHPDGFELLASETPQRLTMPLDQWLPCRYLVSYTWPVPKQRTERDEDGIIRYYKSKKTDLPLIATVSHDRKWVAATCSKDPGNLWDNPERTCHHADPAIDLNRGETKTISLKTFIYKGDLEKAKTLVQQFIAAN